MRRYIISSVSVFSIALTVCVFASSADAQLFRRGTAPVRPRVPTARNPAMVFPTVPVSQVRFVQGAFNARTGAFAPSASGQYWISSRKGFEPIRGQFAPAPNGPFVLTSRQAFNPATGTFAPSPVGNYIFQQRGILTPNAGNYSQTSTGAFNPQTGAFVPNNKGAFTLSSRGSFVPSNGTFVPFATGNFVLSVRSALDPKTGNFVPSPTGDYNFTSRGAFVPSASFAATNGIPSMPAVGPLASVNPRGTVTPINMPTFNVTPTPALAALRLQQMAALNNAAALSGVNPYLPGVVASSMLTNPYLTAAYAQPPQAGYGGGYGGYSYPPPNAYNPGGSYGGGYGGSGYGSGANYGAQASGTNIPAYAPTQQKQMTALDAFGVPSDNGGVSWPLAFRMMSPAERKELLQPAEAQLVAASQQAAAGQANPRIVDEARVSVAKLRQWLRNHRIDFAEGTYASADRFLRRADEALDAMKQ